MTQTQRTNLTIVAWAVLVIAPGLLIQLVKHPGPETDLGSVAWIWLLGYVVQFGFVYVVIAVAHRQKMWWWFGASILPWVVDWTMPVGPLPATAAVLAVLAFAAYMIYDLDLLADFEDHGRHVDATVLKVLPNHMNVVINGVYLRRKVLLEIPAADGTTYQGTLHVLTEIGQTPSVGDTIPLLVDPDNPKRYKENVSAS